MERAQSTKAAPTHAGFNDMESALHYRSEQGGWIFHSEHGNAIWFDVSHTPTAILTHQATRGLAGTLH